ncbi:interleukin-10 receptor subunit alpha isoform X2 [Xenopus laevis]|uniref:Interleukin-10 receptor subunit alpha isoform X2 n=1 Tax=Xenopus laevis TaxID=8355 RepID=A0A8J1LCW0_XENLA|nr:interleukin-10 receptor subunit alpha isoform X2 [Xenopus laevis]
MAVLGASLLGTVLCLSAFLWLGATEKGRIPPAPEDVHFDLQFYSHTLLWSPGNPAAEGILYEVQYYSYGTKLWHDAPHCFLTHHLSCNLTNETLPLGIGYFGRVRSILGNQTSHWVRTQRYGNQEVTLPAPSFSLHVDGSSLMVDVSVPETQAGNFILHYADLFPHNSKYIVRLRRTADNLTSIEEKNKTMFHIHSLIPGREYCVAMQLKITSRLNNGILSPETCVYLPEEELDKSTLLVLATAILVFVTILIFVNIIICLYVRGTVKTPKALTRIMRSRSWMEKPPMQISNCTDSLRWEDEFIDRLMMEPRNSPLRSSGDSGFGSQMLTLKNSALQSTSSILCIDDSGVELAESNSKCKETRLNGDATCKMQFPKNQGEDSGISLSTGSPCLKRSCSIQEVSYKENINDVRDDNCSKNISDSRLGYRRQSEPKKNQNSSESDDPEITHIKDYLTQDGIPRDNSNPQVQKEVLQGSWTNINEGFHSSLPFTAAFSPFSQVLCDFRVNVPTLGDVQLLEII